MDTCHAAGTGHVATKADLDTLELRMTIKLYTVAGRGDRFGGRTWAEGSERRRGRVWRAEKSDPNTAGPSLGVWLSERRRHTELLHFRGVRGWLTRGNLWPSVDNKHPSSQTKTTERTTKKMDL